MSQSVHKLPPEILSRIARDIPSDRAEDAGSIIPLTHVCRYWRETIVSTPEHWASISNRDESLAASSLQRAKAAPLEIRLDTRWVRGSSGFFDLVNSRIQNAKALHFSGVGIAKQLIRRLPNFTQSMPNLRSLTLDEGGAEYIGSESPIDPFESLDPALKHLKLVGGRLYPSLRRLSALTELSLSYLLLRLDTILDVLEHNPSLKKATLNVTISERPSHSPRHRAAVVDQLQHLSITCHTAEEGNALLSNIPLRRGAHLEIITNTTVDLKDILFGIPTAQFPNLSSPISMEHQTLPRKSRLLGPNGSFCFQKLSFFEDPFVDFPLLPLTNIRELHLKHRNSGWVPLDLSFFPALETLAADCDSLMSQCLLSTLRSNPSFPPSLKTLAFLNCALPQDFMKALTQFASDRKNTTSARLHRVVIVDTEKNLPRAAWINALNEHVPVVDARVGDQLPEDLVWR
jgi:hypothetical protein